MTQADHIEDTTNVHGLQGLLVVQTTDYLQPGDAVDVLLRRAGLRTAHAPLVSPRAAGELVEILRGAAAGLVGNEKVTADVLDQLPDLRVLVRTGVGYDTIDVAAATIRGVSVSNLPGINAVAVAEYTVGLILSAARHLTSNARQVQQGSWPRRDGHEIRGATLGVIGYGAAGREVARLAGALGMRVVCTTSHPPVPTDTTRAGTGQTDAMTGAPEFVALEQLLAEADYVSVHTSLTPQTRGLLGPANLRLMRPGSILINTARGPIVDEAALVAAVRDGHLAGAELDVVDDEPLAPDSPLRDVPGINIYPHMAGQTAEARHAAGVEGAREIVAALAGAPRFSLNAHLPQFGAGEE